MTWVRLDFALTALICFFITTVIVALRYYVRFKMQRTKGADDLWLAVSYILFSGQAWVVFASAEVQGSTPTYGMAYNDVLTLGGLTVSAVCLYIVAQIALKLTLGAFMVRIATRGWQRQLLYWTIGIYTTWSTAYFFVFLFECGKPSATMLFFPGPQCLGKHIMLPLAYVATALNAVADWTLVAIPLFAIRGLQMSRKERIAVHILIALGACGSLVSIARLAVISGVFELGNNTTATGIISVVETAVGLIALAAAALRPLFRKVMQMTKYGSKTDRTNKTQQTYQSTRSKVQTPKIETNKWTEISSQPRHMHADSLENEKDSFGDIV